MSNVTGLTVNPTVAAELVLDCVRAGVFPLLKGSPGTSKSSIMHAIAEKLNLKLIDIRLAQIDDVELNGFPDLSGPVATYKPFDIFPIEGQELPVNAEGVQYDGWLLFFDELTSADKTKQGAAYKIILDRMVGQSHLHEKAFCVGAGNLSSDKAVVNNMSTALQSRMVHININVDKDQWVDWAIGAGIDSRIISFIEFKPTLLHKFDPNHNDETFPCPRTWEFASKLLGSMPSGAIPKSKLALLAGTVSQEAAREFMTYTEYFLQLPKFEDIVKDPENTVIPQGSGLLYATVSMLSDHVKEDTCTQAMKYITRLPIEFQLSCVRMLYKRNRTITTNQAVKDWLKETGKEFL